MKFVDPVIATACAGMPLAVPARSTIVDGKIAENASPQANTVGSDLDRSAAADVTGRNLTFNLSCVGTDISDRDAAYLRPSFSKGQGGTGNIADRTVLA